ncbi:MULTISPECIES: MetQ/NlpA family ABC transporter substrate-binding protein [unclassified Janthinobacterium]|uniref:MetQ/NlpA family ABC transporter substrate-binding protein n=1 Tax=unclassified Janthinobacterium TaxID=2610881 RepID=UPI001610FA42|nr:MULTISPECIES: MetQ/NlpA family ABC transporter substrate-binding protein [unclassified Janthinobacterium]MBB5368910.1 D-methionine transport system substrate-binding protein [Janthinobacterium sp. K2C7]MBB5381554.1 D-methionine transport system substrate-binding protein [Janthinobacterium sp. K2Li3]MBB5387292.1 D-methionine transport system substrate-binding protein [Janthinobacterium sp. K2E3]
MNTFRRNLLLAAVSLTLSISAYAKDPKELVIGTSAGPYADQLKLGIKPILEKQGYKVKIVEFNDYVQPNYALAEGSLDANVFQHIVYLNKFATDNKLALSPLITVPTTPIALYSTKHKSLAEIKPGATIAMPNDPTNQARALVVLDKMGWIKLKPNVDPLRASERDVADNPKKLKLVPLEAAQLPRSLADTDYAFINGNYAQAAGIKLTSALIAEKISDSYVNLVAIRTADKGKPWVKDIEAAYRSRAFLDITNKYFAGYEKTDYQLAMEKADKK